MMEASLALFFLFVQQVPTPDALPPELRQVIESRRADTSEVAWTLTYHGGRDDGLVERFITRTSGDDAWQLNLGDVQGHHRIGFSGPTPIPPERLAGPKHVLRLDGMLWTANAWPNRAPSTATVLSQDHGMVGPRAVDPAMMGLTPMWDTHSSNVLGLHHSLVKGFETATITRHTQAGIKTIYADYPPHAMEWKLDLTRGGTPIGSTVYFNDQVWYHSEVDLMNVADRWIPRTIRFYNRDELEPYKVLDVQEASYDQPWHQKEFSPDDIGLVFGTQVGQEDGARRWSGEGLITTEDYYDLIYLDGLRPHPDIIESMAASQKQSVEEYLQQLDELSERWRAAYFKKHGEKPWLITKSPDEKDQWYLYVAAFIKEHDLDEPRVERAHDLLDRAKKLRDHYRRKNKSDQRKAEKEGDSAKLERIAAIEERIFNRVLKRGLIKLLPRDQRAKAAKN